jgi:hypothetical protein
LALVAIETLPAVLNSLDFNREGLKILYTLRFVASTKKISPITTNPSHTRQDRKAVKKVPKMFATKKPDKVENTINEKFLCFVNIFMIFKIVLLKKPSSLAEGRIMPYF